MNNQEQPKTNWSENVIIVDADFVDSVAFNLIVNFERMIDRRISRADLAQWVECIALDGGVRPDDQQKTDTRQQTHVVLIHDKGTRSLENFCPSDLEEEINAQAFESTLGEFTFSVVNAEGLATKEDFFTDTLRLVAGQKDVKRIMVIPDERYYDIDRVAPEDAVKWYAMINEVFTKYGIGRSAWNYKVMDFGISDARMDQVREELLRYL